MTHTSLPLTFDPESLDPEAAALLPRLASADAVVRRIALLALADLEDEAVLAPIVTALQDDVAVDVRAEAAQVLGAWERADVVEALCAALTDPAHEVREAAAQSLSQLKDAQSGPLLAPWATHADAFVRRAALRGLRELRYAGALEPALNALKADEAAVRLEAVGVLGWLNNVDHACRRLRRRREARGNRRVGWRDYRKRADHRRLAERIARRGMRFAKRRRPPSANSARAPHAKRSSPRSATLTGKSVCKPFARSANCASARHAQRSRRCSLMRSATCARRLPWRLANSAT